MIVVTDVQYSPEWWAARLGKPTASCFHRILGKSLKPVAGSETYIDEILAAWFLNAAGDRLDTPETQRGTGMEEDAVLYYENLYDVDTEVVGFITTDDGRVGCSPDRAVGDGGGLEAKCYMAKHHVSSARGRCNHEHRCQLQGTLWITGWEWIDLVQFNPVLPTTITRHLRDEEWLKAWEPAIADFLERLGAARANLEGQGWEPEVSRG